ncbi:Dyp-type peroxidase [Paraburkholderia sp. ZP32-5]|uniref:Dyp-type peroxidase n=1 Tax=Paraburkholderia sp. ZP32-5 TaxID=2883245 RepID=UPI001F3E9234|nr:Dyp-type peroxidase [Paraburkholderia sp. ZP32-5]
MSNLANNLHLIQGNIFGGFNKDFQDFIFLKFKSASAGRAWIARLASDDFDPGVAGSNSAEVLNFNGQFKALLAQGLEPEKYLAASWANVGLTFAGLKALGIKSADLDLFPEEFKEGMAARADLLGDRDSSAPDKWNVPFKNLDDVHALLIVAADSDALLKARVDAIKDDSTFAPGVDILGVVCGRARLGEASGHEHFGFKDGVSQPGIRGVTPPSDPIGNPNQGQPGQDLLWPGEFVLGYPTQIDHADPNVDGPNPNAGPLSVAKPAWTSNGSYLVFRRLEQDVPNFESHVRELALANNISAELMGARLVGRYKSGCPLEMRSFAPDLATGSGGDPGLANPQLTDNDNFNNNFEFGEDADGEICPLAAHIRKAYPRDEQTTSKAADSESITQTHRILRRGIAYGGSIGDKVNGKVSDPRGLVFVCYQRSIKDQFEFIQTHWVNEETFPLFPSSRPTPGVDPIIAQNAKGSFQVGKSAAAITVKHFVRTDGGAYFLAPSIAALQDIGAGKHS